MKVFQSHKAIPSNLAIALLSLVEIVCPNTIRASIGNILNTLNDYDLERFVIEHGLQKLQFLQGVTYKKSTSFECKYHFNEEKESNLFNFFNELKRFENTARIQGHWIWIEKPENIQLVKAAGLRMCKATESPNYGEYYINGYMSHTKYNSLMSRPEIVLALHR